MDLFLDTLCARNKQRAANFNQPEEAMSRVTASVMFFQGHEKMIFRKRITDPRSLGSRCIKGTDKSTLEKDFSVPLMHLFQIIPKERTLIHSCLATTTKFHKNICFKMRAVGLIKINTK